MRSRRSSVRVEAKRRIKTATKTATKPTKTKTKSETSTRHMLQNCERVHRRRRYRTNGLFKGGRPYLACAIVCTTKDKIRQDKYTRQRQKGRGKGGANAPAPAQAKALTPISRVAIPSVVRKKGEGVPSLNGAYQKSILRIERGRSLLYSYQKKDKGVVIDENKHEEQF
jgi:hypothetical protein